MSALNAFIKNLKKSAVEVKVEPVVKEITPKVEEKVKEIATKKKAYVARRSHAVTRERNERFKEFIESDEAKELLKDVKNTKKLKILVNAFKEKFNELMPLVTAYSIYNKMQSEKN